ncbi:ubiquitin-associated protein 1-like [Megalops cyprinoides]|uniref:ubiquitin-associated protein 1-like n=1 Tax=Megalops cyprinoides TaxID=118141 RepID=UPI001864BEA1|nr:ubiquitin-associated protein 1-like [Megalops cyprinoides]
MAGRRSGADFNYSGPCSYLDEVPFKISDKFRSPAKVGLPVGFCLPDCTSLLAETEYDFSLEQRTVRWGVELEEARAAQERARLQAESASAEQESRRQPASSRDQEAGPGGATMPALNPVLAALRHNAILTPLPAPSLGPARLPSPAPAPQSLNLADFEREEDPFDKLELKTLDDKEELRSILQGQAASPHELAKTAVFHKPNGLVGLPDLEKANRGSPCNIRSLSFPKLSDSAEPSVHTPAPLRSLHNGTPPLTLRGVPQNNYHGHALKESPKQPPPIPTTAPGPPPPAHVVVPSDDKPGQSRALLSLSPSERQCVETVVSMGYPYEGVLKAMQRQGQNVEQVLDYLFVHSRLCERGFDASAVEEGLEMYQCSEEKALHFLQLVSRFREMGFEKDAIKEVLLAHNNDQDKALEALMTRAATS